MSYTLSTIRKLIDLGYEIHVVYWDQKKLTPYIAEEKEGIIFYPRSEFCYDKILQLIQNIKPELLVVSGWMDKEYLKVSKKFKKNGGVVVTGIDTQYRFGMKHFIARLFGFFGYFKRFFSHVWVSGSRQFEFAKHIGFGNDEIIFDLYSADHNLFDSSFQESLNRKVKNYPKIMLFVGRFVEVKGVLNLIEAWNNSRASDLGWELFMIGNGPLKMNLMNIKGINVLDFMSSEQLAQISKDCGCFILPSIKEPWGVVIHEFAAAGLPIICTKSVGSAERFVIDQGNGIIIPSSSVEDILIGIERIINKSDEELYKMGVLSNTLSKRITPLTSALNLSSLIK
jgi:glycosyltransferase involved in cell wall biosynthesis